MWIGWNGCICGYYNSLTPHSRVSNSLPYKRSGIQWRPMTRLLQITSSRCFMPIRNTVLVMNTTWETTCTYLLTQNLTLPKGRERKLVPKYIGPYKVVKAHNEASTVMLELPPALIAWHISPTFHMGLVQKFITNNDKLFPKWDAKSFYDFGQDNKQEWLVKEITSHQWMNSKELKLKVRWMLGDTTWEPLVLCKDLQALVYTWSFGAYPIHVTCQSAYRSCWSHESHMTFGTEGVKLSYILLRSSQ